MEQTPGAGAAPLGAPRPRRPGRRAARLCLLLIAVAAVVFAAVDRGRDRRLVTVTVENDTQRTLASVRLVHGHGAVEARRLGPGASRRLRFDPGGESSYHLEVAFADGGGLRGGESYVEGGYHLREHVGEHGIATSLDSLAY
ncbi:MAG TPA: hypothetical protein VFA75_15835 [Nevskia sp.]|nr:hypothetical protein [Nevskia sp.]